MGTCSIINYPHGVFQAADDCVDEAREGSGSSRVRAARSAISIGRWRRATRRLEDRLKRVLEAFRDRFRALRRDSHDRCGHRPWERDACDEQRDGEERRYKPARDERDVEQVHVRDATKRTGRQRMTVQGSS